MGEGGRGVKPHMLGGTCDQTTSQAHGHHGPQHLNFPLLGWVHLVSVSEHLGGVAWQQETGSIPPKVEWVQLCPPSPSPSPQLLLTWSPSRQLEHQTKCEQN